MSVQENMATLYVLLGTIGDGLDEYVVAVCKGDGAGATEARRRALCNLDSCFDLLDRWIAQCHGRAARRRANNDPPNLTIVDGGLN